MSDNAIHPDAKIGAVKLKVRDLQRAIDFYTKILGFRIVTSEDPTAMLGVGDVVLLHLQQNPGARPAPRTAGLYHFAVLVPSRLELARSLKHLIETRTPLQGFADHLVSEAIYLADPEGNGIEIYRDRPRDQWSFRDGQLLMATDPLDVNGLLDELAGSEDRWSGLAKGTTIGHIHLQVSDLARSMEFYERILGLDLILRYGPTAAFLSAGGYHHHVGINTWAGSGIPPAPEEATGLEWFTVDLPDREAYQRYVQRLNAGSAEFDQRDQSLLIRDPSGIAVQVRVAST